ncbi:hypothetical protein Tco_0858824 [Tanacetum coccineum]|uniref:Uncharacterized protein n=1 Tax=Tanacetum coccineum TaxID=301880 RepID=A0ABQ5BD96_9ASTR
MGELVSVLGRWFGSETVGKGGMVLAVVMSSASSAVTYTSVYTDSKPGRVFWGADEEISDGGSPRVIDEDERKPRFIQPHDPDYVPEPIYPEYIPLEDEHEFPVEEQPLPPVVSPTAESPGYVIESDPEEDPEEYEDDKTEDGPVDYPMDGGEDGDDDGHSSGDDADDKDADEQDEDEDDEEEEEEHLAPVDSAVVVPIVEHGSISLLPEAEVERLLAMPTPPPSPPISLLPPSTRERLARYMAPPAHSSLPPVPLPLLPSSGCLTQIQTLRIASTHALVDAVTATLPSPLLPPLPPSLYIPPPVDRRDDIPESERPPCKRSCLFALGSRYEVEESSTARPTRGRGVDYGFVSTLDAKERRRGIREVGYGIRDTWVDSAEAVPEIAPMTMGEVDLLIGDRMTLKETVLIMGEEAYASREAWAHAIELSQAVHYELQTHRTAPGMDGRDSPCDERYEVRDGSHAGRVVSTARAAEES